jgi:putative ABC transport system permease protein
MTASIDNTVNISMDSFKWDYDIRLAGSYDKTELEKAAASVPGLKDMEIWQGSSGFFSTKEGMDTTAYQVKIAPPGAKLADLPGLDKADDAIMLNKALADEEKWISKGSTVLLQAGSAKATVRVLQIIDEVPAIPSIYISSGTYARLFGPAPRQMLMATANTKDMLGQRAITRDIEAKFSAAGIVIAENWNIHVLRKAFTDHLKVIITLLSVIAALAVAVGGLGIGSAIGINVSERRHETGVLRAIGAAPRRIYFLILAEVMLMGLAGWLAGALLSIPVSMLTGNYFGQIFLHTNLDNVLSLPGSAIWLGISLAVAFISGFLPARNAAQAPLKEMLAYE